LAAPKAIVDLIEKFERNKPDYIDKSYNEAQVRQEFIDPLFETLLWDMDNEQGLSEAYKEVLYEASLKVGNTTKAPDYAFRARGVIKFLVEAKKPFLKLSEDPKPAYQLRSYAWNAKLPISILTDFEEFRVYDCRYPPKETDSANTALLFSLEYADYLTRWDEIAERFSKAAVVAGSFDEYVKESKDERGTKEVDVAFLEEINSWRESLARNMASQNLLRVNELNRCVQSTIDRIVFLRICEDRGIERYGQLQEISRGTNIYAGLCDLFKHADDRYNSGIFHFREEPDRDAPDLLSLSLTIDDKILRDIIHSLYPPSPYNFAIISSEILGQVYEQFLGKVIRLVEGGSKAIVEDKPEVKKAGGVYYTPTYIVDYIIENTLGKLLEGKTHPNDISKLTILDPACGSGSFLLGAYKMLLAWHLEWYSHKLGPLLDKHVSLTTPEIERLLPIPIVKTKKRKARARIAAVAIPIYKDERSNWRLTIQEKRRILVNNIFGVDIDLQAVEVAKLALLLKVLEGESQEAVQTLLRWSGERALPDLSYNIKCGNSLVDLDYLGNRPEISLEEYETTKPFSWIENFPEIMNVGGFDIVIGNPPYIDSEWMCRCMPSVRTYCNIEGKYIAAMGNWDIFCTFIEKALSLCKKGGLSSFIVPNKLGSADYASGARKVLTEENSLISIRDYSSVAVFPVAVYPIVYVCKKVRPDANC
jgi:hypothetical protein